MFNVKISLYGIFIIISILSGMFIVYKNSRNLDFKSEEIFGLLIYIVVGIIFGAKYFTFFTNLNNFKDNFNFVQLGLSSYGAVIGVIVMVFFFSKQFHKNLKDLIYALMPAIPLMYGIGKIGCFLSGCCYGIEYSGFLSVSYRYSFSAPDGVQLFPVQLLEAVIFMLIFIFMYLKVNKNKSNYFTIGQFFIVCGISKFLLDYLRMSHIGKIFSINQIVSLFFIIIGLYLILMCKLKTLTFFKKNV